MTQYFCLCKSLPRKFILYVSNYKLDSENYYIFRSKEDAVHFWRSFYLRLDIKGIENFFNKHQFKNFYYHIFVLVQNTKTNKTIQYLLEDMDSKIVINKIWEGFKTLKLLNQDYKIHIYFDIKQLKRKNSVNRCRKEYYNDYLGAVNLYRFST